MSVKRFRLFFLALVTVLAKNDGCKDFWHEHPDR